jgi:hypothetical protein
VALFTFSPSQKLKQPFDKETVMIFIHNPRKFFTATLLGLSLVTGLTQARLRHQVVSAANPAAIIANLQESPGARLHNTSAGSLNGVNLVQENGAIFLVEDADALASFKQWVMSNTALLKLDPINDESVLDELRLSPRPPARFENLTVYRFEQTYRGHKIVGTEATIHLTVTNDGRAVAITGTVLDPRVTYSGLSRRLSDDKAGSALLTGFRSRKAAASANSTVKEVELVAVPARKSLGYRSEITVNDQTVETVVVSAVDGAVFGVEDNRHKGPFDHQAVHVMAHEMDDNPATTDKILFGNLPGSIYGGCLPPINGGCRLRLGDDRAAVYDFRRNNNAVPTIWTTTQFFPFVNPPVSFRYFLANSEAAGNAGDQFRTQNVFQKVNAALAVADPLKAAQGWDHHPNAPFGVFSKAPLSIFTNVETSLCDGNPGCTNTYTFTSEWNQVEHPYVANNYQTAMIALATTDEKLIFHELGHYYDLHTNYGIIGQGLVSDTCTWDTPDESKALAETIADMTALYLYKKLYTGLNYTLSTTAHPCSFLDFGVPGVVHHNTCINDNSQMRNFQNDRPSASAAQPCNVSTGYQQGAIMQAFWEYLSGQSCDEDAPYNCQVFKAIPDRAMSAILYAESLSNLQSYEQFFENMGTYLLFTYGQNHYNQFHEIMQHHGILP